MNKHNILRALRAVCFLALFSSINLRAYSVERFVDFSSNGFVWIDKGGALPVLVDAGEDRGVLRAVANLQTDAEKVTGERPEVVNECGGMKKVVVVGTVAGSKWIGQLVKQRKIDGRAIEGKNEKYLITVVDKPFEGVDEALVIAGSDKRGAIYGVYELAQQMGVSPWHYWADVPAEKHEVVSVVRGEYTDGEPAVKYRGIFLNDEWPCLGGWASKTFGGFNSKFYEHLFDLVLRLKGNFIWPAMWASAFYDDDPLNGPLADEMGVVMGTSHHEPMALAQQDWKRRGKGKWDYSVNEKELREFWTGGMERCKDWETVVTVGMRGDGDEAMSDETNTELLERIVDDQRKIIEKVTGKKAKETPQVWALYKEVQDYYDKGMRVPDDVTLLLCDDNWGNVRRLPALDAKKRKGGYGMYYHFDYVGAPRNSKWTNITQIERTWEQMNLCYEHGVRELWVVNVGDLKPMEYPITFFLDMAWNPTRFNHTNLSEHTRMFCKQQLGGHFYEEAARLIETYTKYNRRVTPELLNEQTFSLDNYDEWRKVKDDYVALSLEALRIYFLMPQEYKDVYNQLVLFPIQAVSNLYEMYYAVAMNRKLAANNDAEANVWAEKVRKHFERDSLLTHNYENVMSGGKWKSMMSQTHIGYRIWQEPRVNSMPRTTIVEKASGNAEAKVFVEKDGYVSVEAENATRMVGGDGVEWITIPNLGRTLSAVTTSPCTAVPAKEMCLEYDFATKHEGEVKVTVRCSSTLNYNDYKGMRYAVSIDGGDEQVININGHYKGELGRWQAEHVIQTVTAHKLKKGDVHTLRLRPLDAGLVIQKVMIDMGGLKPSFLGPTESGTRRQ